MFGAPPKELPQKIAFLLVPNFSMIAFTSAVEPLRLANRASGQDLYSWHLFSPDGQAGDGHRTVLPWRRKGASTMPPASHGRAVQRDRRPSL
jgi:transcriptional regulator GlxA family with amidase domain